MNIDSIHRNELKISMVSHLKYASDEDLKQVGLSKPEIRRLRKFYEKFYPHGYLSKIKRLLQTPVTKEHGIVSKGIVNSLAFTYCPSDSRLLILPPRRKRLNQLRHQPKFRITNTSYQLIQYV